MGSQFEPARTSESHTQCHRDVQPRTAALEGPRRDARDASSRTSRSHDGWRSRVRGRSRHFGRLGPRGCPRRLRRTRAVAKTTAPRRNRRLLMSRIISRGFMAGLDDLASPGAAFRAADPDTCARAEFAPDSHAVEALEDRRERSSTAIATTAGERHSSVSDLPRHRSNR